MGKRRMEKGRKEKGERRKEKGERRKEKGERVDWYRKFSYICGIEFANFQA